MYDRKQITPSVYYHELWPLSFPLKAMNLENLLVYWITEEYSPE